MAPSAITVIENINNENTIHDKVLYNHLNGVSTPKGLIGNAINERVGIIDHQTCGVGEEDAFFVADLGEVYRQHMRWKLNLPRVKPFYGTFYARSSEIG